MIGQLRPFPGHWNYTYFYCPHCGKRKVFVRGKLNLERKNMMACAGCGSRWAVSLHGVQYKTLPQRVGQSYNGTGKAGGE